MRAAPILALVLGCALCAAPAQSAIWPSVVERVTRDMRSGDAAVRRAAAERIGDLPSAAARRLAAAALDDGDVEVRLRAIEVALDVGVSGIGDKVLPWLAESEPRLRLAAAEALGRQPAARAVVQLGRTLSDSDPQVRAAAARALGASESADAVLPLLGRLDDSVPEVRQEVVSALARLGDARAVVPLIGKVEDARPGVRRAVARALGELGDARSVGALVLSLRDADDDVKVSAIGALGRIGDPGAAPSIIALLANDPAPHVRSQALSALGRLGTPDALNVLLAELSHDEPGRERGPVLEALERAGPSALSLLRACLQGPAQGERNGGCALALGATGDRTSAPLVVLAMERGAITPEIGLEALGRLGERSVVPAVLEHLRAADPRVRAAARAAAAALLEPSIPDGRAVDPLARALAAPRLAANERVELVALLGRTGAPRAAAALLPLGRDATDPVLREAALEALGTIGSAGQDAVLLDALGSEHPGVRRAAALALRKVGGKNLAAELVRRLERAAEQDRSALALALGGAHAHSDDRELVAREGRLVRASRDGERDELIEALGRSTSADALRELGTLLKAGSHPADRAKVAEALAANPSGLAALRGLARDVDGAVRANAVWGLGALGGDRDLTLLRQLLTDRDPAVAANAALALGRAAARSKAPITSALCSGLSDARGYVRAAALGGLRLAAQRCEHGVERRLLLQDPFEPVREAAARLLGSLSGDALDKRAIARCVSEDVSSRVAAVCENPLLEPTRAREPVTVFVVPAGESAPTARAPFALAFADGTLRLGLTDRRGAVYEPAAPHGVLELGVPAPAR